MKAHVLYPVPIQDKPGDLPLRVPLEADNPYGPGKKVAGDGAQRVRLVLEAVQRKLAIVDFHGIDRLNLCAVVEPDITAQLAGGGRGGRNGHVRLGLPVALPHG